MTSREPDWDSLAEPPGARVRRHFASALEVRGYRADDAQQAAIDTLAGWLDTWLAGRRGWLRRPVAGIYLWGGVGRGKSFVMDAFFAAAPVQAKRRVHFHAFLQELQARMNAHAGQADPLALVAREVARETRLLCFDEFHVHDIGDAMLLGRLLKVLVEEGVGLVCTSNYPPEGLCPNPLYRERFRPAIALIEKRFRVIELDGGEDYRQHAGELETWGGYAWPLGEGAERWLAGELELELDGAAIRARVREVNHHPLAILAEEGERIVLDFAELCRKPHSSADFLWLCRHYRRIALSGVPCLDGEGIEVQQRFLNFVDIAYDSGVRLHLACEAALDALCRADSHVDFARTRSRLRQLRPVPLTA
ncbi:cell division protein ZapE [Zestomonas carbonaria]|uniref:Cell division protein ZapE n=1 Tax=Zestomonas carbonaria TaxID=2762745 RepID=A0A7U7ESD3_9GAMM|nr:cell division protein ZapE [Pseudomonas carbonaria]CAD5109822.1 Cell division protein ZapE [Pseudomonas carbonaria]